jgi:type IV pilus assembly protein PilV
MKIKQRGGIMVEVLVSMVLFGTGVVGLLGFLGTSATLSADSRYRTEAAVLADELFGEMVAANISTLSTNYDASSPRFAAWKDRVAGLLPNGNANINFTPGERMDGEGNLTGNSFVTLTITWKAPSDTQTDTASGGGHKYVTSTYFY